MFGLKQSILSERICPVKQECVLSGKTRARYWILDVGLWILVGAKRRSRKAGMLEIGDIPLIFDDITYNSNNCNTFTYIIKMF